MKSGSRKIAILFRYGAGEHVDFLPALPELVRRLRAEGVEVHHFGFRGEVAAPESLRNEWRVHEGPFRVRRRSEWDKRVKAGLWLLWLPFLGRRLEREGFERVFVDETLPLSAALLRRTYRGSLSFTVHDFFIEIYWSRTPWLRAAGRWIQQVDLRAWRRLDHVFTRVESAKKFWVARGIDAERISVAADPVDLDMFSPSAGGAARLALRTSLGVTEGEVLMTHHGVMHPNKGNVRLVEAMHRVKDRWPQLKLLLIGDGPEMKEVRRRCAELDLGDRVILTGWLPGLPDIAEMLRASDIGLVMRKGWTGDHFHVTSTLVHNMACGLPVLAARLDGVGEVVEEGREGCLFDPACGAEFDEKLAKMLSNPSLRKQMGEQARRTAETRFSAEKIAGIYLRAWRE